MKEPVNVTLKIADVLQILDALESRAEAYEKTAVLMRVENGESVDDGNNSSDVLNDGLDQFFVPEACRDSSEADQIAKHFRDIMAELEKQLEKHRTVSTNH